MCAFFYINCFVKVSVAGAGVAAYAAVVIVVLNEHKQKKTSVTNLPL